jgi:hypothetical protein
VSRRLVSEPNGYSGVAIPSTTTNSKEEGGGGGLWFLRAVNYEQPSSEKVATIA